MGRVMQYKNYVYAIRNTKTKRIYIGRTWNVQNRCRQHMTALYYHRHENELMQSDYDKYGLDSFTFSVIDVIAENTGYYKEHEWMRRFNTTDPDFGYNFRERLIQNDEWAEPEWVKELKTKIGACPDRRNPHNKGKGA